MIRCERQHDAISGNECRERVEEGAEPLVEAQYVVVHFARVGPVCVADGIGGGKRDREQIGRLAVAQRECTGSIECERERQRIHPRIADSCARTSFAVAGNECGKVNSLPPCSNGIESGSL